MLPYLAVANPTFAAIDWFVVIAYMMGVLGMGLWLSRGQKDRRDYFLGGREIKWWVVGLSIVATETSALTFIGVPAMAFGALNIVDGKFISAGGNILFIQVIIGYVIARFIIALCLVPAFFKGDVYTPYQLLTRAFGSSTRTCAAVFSLIGLVLGQGVRVYVTAIPVMILGRTVFPDFGIWSAVVVIMVVALAYTVVGGIKAVVWTDMVQFLIFAGGAFWALLQIVSVLKTPTGATGWAAMVEVAAPQLRWWNLGFPPVVPDGATPTFLTYLWTFFGGDFNIWMGLVGATFAVLFNMGVDQLNVQRVLACRDAKEGGRAMILSALLILPQFLMFLLIGVALFAFYKLNGFAFGPIAPWDPASINVETGLGVPKADYVFPIYILSEMPAGLKGFLIAAILAAAMSTVSSALSAMASIFVMDLYRPFAKRPLTDAGEIALGRWATLLSGVLLVAVAILCKSEPRVFDLAFRLTGLTAGAILGAVLIAVWRRSGHPGSIIAGMLASLAVMILLNVLISYKIVAVNWPWHTMIGTLVCMGVALGLEAVKPRVVGRDVELATAGE